GDRRRPGNPRSMRGNPYPGPALFRSEILRRRYRVVTEPADRIGPPADHLPGKRRPIRGKTGLKRKHKTRSRRRPATDSLADSILLRLINGADAAQVEAETRAGGESAANASRLVATARRRITLAADYNRDEQVGRAVLQLDDLFARSVKADDAR